MSLQFVKNFLLTGSSTIVVIIISILNNIIVTRWIGVKGRGIYGVVLSILMLLNLLFGEGTRRSNTIILSESEENLSRVIVFNLLILLFLALLAGLAVFLYDYFILIFPNIPFKIYLLMLLSGLFFIMWNSTQGIYLGLNNYHMYNLIPVAVAVIIFLLNVVGIYLFHVSLVGIFVNILVAYFVVFIVPFLLVLKKAYREGEKASYSYSKLNFLMMTKATFSSVGVFVFRRSNIFFVNNILGVHDAGLYSVANIFSDLIQKIPNVAGVIVFSDSAKKDTFDFNQKVALLVKATFFLNLLVIAILYFWGGAIIEILFGAKFAETFVVLKAMLIGFAFSAPTTIIHAFFMGKGFPSKMILFNWITAIIAVIANYLLVSYWHLIGAGLSFSLSYVIWGIFFFAYFSHYTKIPLSRFVVVSKRDLEFSSALIRSVLSKLRIKK